ncbi:MAG: crossover junction endodeoxyribonuclease RuvC [Acidobacteriia bacterium]|nr:crossover junction endodeoxyribonuclease RuvC [Terriglobia bacterium]
MRVLGIDCGSERTGYGVIDSNGVDHRMVVCGVIRTDPRTPFEQRLLEIAAGLRQLIRQHLPDAAAVEGVFHAVNAKTALKLAHVRGVALLAVAEAGLEVGEYSPLEVKVSVVGYGRAEKQQVQMMVRMLLHASEAIESEDASDALAVAICHATRGPRSVPAAGLAPADRGRS